MKSLLITPPFSQLNTPYPATCYLTGFLKSKGFDVTQRDLGIKVINSIFSKRGLERVFNKVTTGRVGALKNNYLITIDPVISFLQGRNPNLGHRIVRGEYLPQSDRFDNTEESSFGELGIQDHARYLATLYLNDIGDYITKNIDQNFGFSRYSERLALSPSSFDSVEDALESDSSLISDFISEEWQKILKEDNYDVICITIPFPGNLLSALKIAKEAKNLNPSVKIIIGGGWVNTELRELTEKRLFKYVDYVVMDDGEAPLENLFNYLNTGGQSGCLHRTYIVEDGKVQYKTNNSAVDYTLDQLPAPDYSGLDLSLYISLLDTVNPMHSLWNNGRWNKLTLAHGCYWKKCAFCDTTLPYICNFHQSTAKIVVDKIEKILEQTKESGFHFVDEAAPPALLRDISLEILRRGITITWWTNIRFEKSFNSGLAKLMAKSGCIGVSGGVEVASNRLLSLMDKGVTVDQVAAVTGALGQEGIMVHAYLMYGFPTQTTQEIIDALEVVRQLFSNGLIQSAYWHQFALTAHSGVGKNPKGFNIKISGSEFKGFARNDLEFKADVDYDKFSEGLRISLYNYMRGNGLDAPLNTWFNFRIPKPNIKPMYVSNLLRNNSIDLRDSTKLIWLGGTTEYKDGYMYLYDNTSQERLQVSEMDYLFVEKLINSSSYLSEKIVDILEAEKIAAQYNVDIDSWLSEDIAIMLYSYGLVLI